MNISAENIFKFGQDFLAKTAEKFKKRIKEDGINHIFQNGNKDLPYRSKQYKKYKANSMKRFTHGGEWKQDYTFNKAGDIKFYKRLEGNFSKLKFSKKSGIQRVMGDKLKAYADTKGVSINTDVSAVNMFLTGQLYNRMKSRPLDNGFEISFDPLDAGKVLGNQKLGRDLVGLREERIKECQEDFTKELERQIGEIDYSIKITVG